MTPENGSSLTRPARAGAGTSILQWAATRTAQLRACRVPAPVRAPRRRRIQTPRISAVGSLWAARVALRAGMPIEDFLRHRLSEHLARLSVPPARLPIALRIGEGGEIGATAGAPAQARRAPWLAAFLRAHGAAALSPEVQLAQAEAAALAARIDEQRRRADELARDLQEATRGAEIADPADESEAERMGRPHVPPPFGAALQALCLALLLAEGWQLALPCLEAAGIRTADLGGELRANPLGLSFGALLALGAATSLFVLAHVALRRVLDILADPGRAGRAAPIAIAAGAATLAAALAWSVAAFGAAGHPPIDARYAQAVAFLTALGLPASAAWLLRVAGELDAERGRALALARAWDQAHHRALSQLSRRAAAAAEEERRWHELEAQRATVLRRLRALKEHAACAERLAADAADAEEHELARVAQAVVAALEHDRYEFLRQGGTADERRRGTLSASAPSTATDVPAQNLGLAS